MEKVATYFAMTLGAFSVWQSMDEIHVRLALRQDDKRERMEKEASRDKEGEGRPVETRSTAKGLSSTIPVFLCGWAGLCGLSTVAAFCELCSVGPESCHK